MAVLADTLRRTLENEIQKARTEAEKAAINALTTLAVNRSEAFSSLLEEDKKLRVKLRAKARQLGDDDLLKGSHSFSRDWALVRECAYEQWHRMLFARFLAENGLLIHPEYRSPVSLQECAELAPIEGAPDAWMLAARYAAHMLPGIFREDDPLLQVRFAAEGRQALEQILDRIPAPVFTADDSLGWVYQFWQSARKEEVNKSGEKIGGVNIAPVTQLFTEPYMVQFLLHNSLGAWWAAHHPDDLLLDELTYLRRLEDGTPAAGTFDGWPQTAAELKVLDPCCGSGHFLVAAFDLLRLMRETEEGLSPAEAVTAVLRDNLHGLELDARCTQIAAFALALAAWKVTGYMELPVPNVACSGIPVGGRLYEWLQLADGDSTLEMNLRRLYNLFKDAPDLGSLIDPRRELGGDLFAGETEKVLTLLDKALHKERNQDDPTAAVFGDAAKGIVRAAQLLSSKYHLVITNVPYLGRNRQTDYLKQFCERAFPYSKADLATVFIERCHSFCTVGGAYVLVTPQHWLFLGSYKKFREKLLREQVWNHLSRLGSGAFTTISGEIVNVVLLIMSNVAPQKTNVMTSIDASHSKSPAEKSQLLYKSLIQCTGQIGLLGNPDARVSEESTSDLLLAHYADAFAGIQTGDFPRYVRYFWEFGSLTKDWEFYAGPPEINTNNSGMSQVILWNGGQGPLAREPSSVIRGTSAWGEVGIIVGLMRQLISRPYFGHKYDQMAAVIVPKESKYLPALWAFTSSADFFRSVRLIDKSLKITPATLVKVPFNLAHWQAVADAAGPLPESYSNDPTQWLFEGHLVGSTDPLQVAVARLLGYRWPQQKDDELQSLADPDGIICLPAVAGEPPAAERMRTFLAAAYGREWSPAVQEKLLTDVGFGGKILDMWLRDGFFVQHCKLFHNRSFLWHIWDGLRDGFSAIVNYHGLDQAKLDRVIYTYLGDWITTQRNEVNAGKAGSEARLVAAQKLKVKLEAIRDGEPPYDIYVRWKPLHQQPIGWEPDLNDGVRLNIRPFVTAEVLRSKFTINWNKDRGKNPDGSERLNDLHFSRAEKEKARREHQR